MSAVQLITALERAGLRLGLDDTGGLRCYGDRAKVSAYLPIIRQHKPAILRILAGEPATIDDDAPLPDGADPVPSLPPPWDAIRDRIHQGWRAEFGAPGPDGKQAITWIPPGQWEPVELLQEETAPMAYRTTKRPPTGTTSALPVRCCDCRHQQPIGHPVLIRCGAGRESPAACGYWWKSDPRHCVQFARAPG